MKSGEWAAIVGWGSEGRADVTRAVVDGLRARGLALGGCLQETLTENEEIVGYDVVDLDDGRRLALARPSADPLVCNWGFSEEAFAAVATRLLTRPYDLVVLELGPIEARGRGHWNTISMLLERGSPPLLLCIRPRVLARIALDLPDPAHALELPANPDEIGAFIDAVAGSSADQTASDDPAPQQRP